MSGEERKEAELTTNQIRNLIEVGNPRSICSLSLQLQKALLYSVPSESFETFAMLMLEKLAKDIEQVKQERIKEGDM